MTDPRTEPFRCTRENVFLPPHRQLTTIMRSIDELIETKDPRWPEVKSWIAGATNSVTVFPPDATARTEALVATQVTTRSPMGAIVYETGGITVDNGWLRILGSGCQDFPRSLPSWNRACGSMNGDGNIPYMLVADDVAGGFFAINGGAMGEDIGKVHYVAPDTLDWEPMDVGYTDFILWAFSGDLASFYDELRWTDWRYEIADLQLDRIVSFYPMLWTQAESLDSRNRSTIPILEAFRLQSDFADQMNDR